MYFLLGIILAGLAMALVGIGDFLSGITARRTNEKVSIISIFFFQTLVSALFWLIFKHTLQINPLLVCFAFVAGIFQMFGLLFFYRAMKTENISLISPIFAISSVITILFGIFVLKEFVSLYKLLALLIIIIGTVCASTDFSFGKSKAGLNTNVGYALVGSFFFGIGFLFITLALKEGEFYLYNTLYAFSTCIFGLLFFHREVTKHLSEAVKNKRIFLLPLVIGIIYTTLNTLYALSLKMIPSYLGAAIFSAYPAITVILGYLFLKERLTKSQTIGIVGIIIGLILASAV